MILKKPLKNLLMPVLPYIIHHLQMQDGLLERIFSPEKGGRYYCLFWWHSIPLGELYIEQYNNSNELRQSVLMAIEPAINFYALKSQTADCCIKAFNDGNYAAFSDLMSAIFSVYLQPIWAQEVAISVIICTRNRSEQLEICLQSLLKQIGVPKEIIVVDNAPLDDSSKEVVGRYNTVTYCREIRKGLDLARNTGAKSAKFPIIAYIDDDVHLHPLWTLRVWDAFHNTNADAMTGLIIASSLETESQQIFERHWKFNKGYTDKKFDDRFLKASAAPRVWEIGAGANMAFRKSVLEQVNYFDERLDAGAAGCNGDSEIWYRILAAGYTINYNPRAVVYHEHRKKLTDLHEQLFNYMRGHAAAALIQHAQNKHAGYKKHLYYDTAKYYLLLLKLGFPSYSFRYKTLFSEIKGIVSGIRFFQKNKNIPPLTQSD